MANGTASWKPGSKVTASTLAGMVMSMVWEIVMQFELVADPRPTMVAGSVTLVMAAVAYWKAEKAGAV